MGFSHVTCCRIFFYMIKSLIKDYKKVEKPLNHNTKNYIVEEFLKGRSI